MLFLAVVIVMTTSVSLLFYLSATRSIQSEIVNEWNKKTSSIVDQSPPNVSPKLHFFAMWLLFCEFVAISVLGYVWYYIFISKIESSAQKIIHALNQLSRGQLSETINIEDLEEFQQIGSGINELTANLQELLLCVWKQTGQCLIHIEKIQNNADLRYYQHLSLDCLGYLKQLKECMDNLREIAKTYVFYDVILDGNKTHAVNEPSTFLRPETYSETKSSES